MTTIFEDLESEVRSYCRIWPTVFDRAVGSWVYEEGGRAYLDFFSGAGALNYGHNNPVFKKAVVDYLAHDGVTHALDMNTVAKRDFLETFSTVVLKPRDLDYRVQFPGPTGANAVEAALKLARMVTGRHTVVTFTNAFHGMTLGALSLSGNRSKRRAAGVPLDNVVAMPYDAYLDGRYSDLHLLDGMLADRGSGLEVPAAAIVETVQGEGGVNVARASWLRELAALCHRYGILLIVDDVQMGCGRTGRFFSFEDAGIVPDIVCMAKSIGGFGLPMALTLIRRELDVWAPGEHNGTFRGNNVAFVAATAALRHYWSDDILEKSVLNNGVHVAQAIDRIAATVPGAASRGRGMVRGLALPTPGSATKVVAEAFDRGLLVETSGADDQVVKLLPPLTTSITDLDRGLEILDQSVRAAVR
jgi:diaminobutyrate-2-oxoglutarate transaminase